MDISVLTAGGTDTVLAANGKTAIAISIDLDIGTGRLSTAEEGGSAGGGFAVATNRTVRANVLAGTAACITMSSGAYTLRIYGNVTGGSAPNTVGILGNGSASTIVVFGDVTGGSNVSAYGMATSYSGATVNGSLIANNAPAIFQGQLSAILYITNGNIINSVYSPAIYGRAPVGIELGPNNYIEYVNPSGVAIKYGATIPAESVLSGVNGDGADAPATGTVTLPSEDDVKLGVTFGPSGAMTGTFEPVPDIDLGSVIESLAAIQAQTDRLVITDGRVAAEVDTDAIASAIAAQIPTVDSGLIAADVVAAIQAGTYGVGTTLRTFVSKVAGVPTPGVVVAVYRDASLTQQHGGTQVSDGFGRTFWFVAPGATYYVRQQRDGYTFPVEVEVG